MHDWLDCIDEKRRVNFVRILAELSLHQDKKELNFIIIGALTLLITNYLKYTAYWDIDLLFRDVRTLRDFISKSKSHNLRIVNYDDELMISEKITSFHTAWSFSKSWFNVDYILREGFFEFYAENLSSLNHYTTIIELKDGKFPIDLCLAHPWDVFVEKVLSPRLEKDMDLKIDLSVDLRHIYIIYNNDMMNANFWNHIRQKIEKFDRTAEFKTRLQKILSIAPELGYHDIKIPDFVQQFLI